MKIVWTQPALSDLDQIARYLQEQNPTASERIVSRIAARARDLSQFPLSGREGRIPGTRELVVTRTDYVLPYRAFEDRVEIIAVLHGAREWPEHFPDGSR